MISDNASHQPMGCEFERSEHQRFPLPYIGRIQGVKPFCLLARLSGNGERKKEADRRGHTNPPIRHHTKTGLAANPASR
jgi:hypothetical protein